MTQPDNTRHPTKAISSLARGKAGEVARRRALRHLAAGCPECAAALDRARHPPAATPSQLTAVLERVAAGAPELVRNAMEARRRAGALAERLVALDEEQARLRLANTEPADRRALVHELLSRAEEHRGAAPHETRRIARLAVAAAEVEGLEELRPLALAELGNAARIAGDLGAAEAALGEAWELVVEHGTDPLDRAEVLSLRASLARYQRRFEEGLRLARRALHLFQQQDDEPGMAKTLIQLGFLHRDLDQPEPAIARLVEAVEHARLHPDPEASVRLMMIAVQNLAYCHVENGQPTDALFYIQRGRLALDAVGTRLDRLRFDWLEARVWTELGRWVTAAGLLKRLRAAYLDEDLPYEAALVSLELAAALARLGRRQALIALATETAGLFTRLGVDREAMAALGLLAQAKAAEVAGLASRLAAEVRRARPAQAAAGLD